MSITIDENLLSPKARQALNNAKNKSKLLRDAFEAYINLESDRNNRDNIVSVIDEQTKNDIKEIKDILINLQNQGQITALFNKEIACTKTDENIENKEESELNTKVLDSEDYLEKNNFNQVDEVISKKEPINFREKSEHNIETNNMLKKSFSQFTFLDDDED